MTPRDPVSPGPPDAGQLQRWHEETFVDDASELPPGLRALISLWTLLGEVGNGGLMTLWEHEEPATAQALLDAAIDGARLIGALDHAHVLSAFSTIGPQTPEAASFRELQARGDEVSEDTLNRLSSLEQRLFALEGPDALLAAYAQAHPEEFPSRSEHRSRPPRSEIDLWQRCPELDAGGPAALDGVLNDLCARIAARDARSREPSETLRHMVRAHLLTSLSNAEDPVALEELRASVLQCPLFDGR